MDDEDPPFPVAAARDLLGIVRALYRMRRAQGAGYADLRRYEAIGSKLARAIEIAGHNRHTSRRCAHVLANEAIHALDDIFEMPEPLAIDVLNAARPAVGADPKHRRRA